MLLKNSLIKAVLITTVCALISCKADTETDQNSNHQLRNLEKDDCEILVISLLDGSLIGVDPKSGNLKWKLQNEPTVKVPAKSNSNILPVFLPDPKDGTLYSLNTAEHKALKKLPFTIQQLVASSPSRSSDGMFYSGKKIDTWFSVDIATGKKLPLLGNTDLDRICPIQSSNSLFIGRTEYNLIILDSKSSNRHWNITYYDYTSHSLTKDQTNNYGYVHIGSSVSGRVRTWDRNTGELLWEKDFGSPMVSIFERRGHDIITLPFSSIAESTFNLLPFLKEYDTLQSTLYIGKYDHGIYALPSLVDKSVVVVPDNAFPKRLLLGGPESNEEFNAVVLGHYKFSSVSQTQLLLTGRSDPIIPTNISSFNYTKKGNMVPQQSSEINVNWNLSSESKILAIIVGLLSLFVVGMFMYIMAQVRDIKLSSQGSSGTDSTKTASYIQTQQGIISVGKISFDTRQVLGKGCEGTFVFRGTFDGRNVAVKRLLPECFTFASREVQLLRESDAHPNVIRYFSTEEDSQFRYIALELCSATLQDYVERDVHRNDISCMEVLKQALMGLEHLHDLKIVHRDVKPHNILISISSNTSVRAMISDFGLCKKLQNGKMSFSRRSGITGTEGWIAPEMMECTGRITSAVDIFSLGCVFYYTITNGKHPFGEPIRRQSNILSGECRIFLQDELWKSLIMKMLNQNPSERPSAATVKIHPVFWEKAYTLTFLQDVSDRIEKADSESEALLNLEKGGECVYYKGDWRPDIDAEVLEDLGKYRSYRGDSIRDLLRALRNKRHHYRELSAKAQELLGSTAESYVNYWLSRFPTLLYHSWSSLQMLRSEPAFIQYYDSNFVYPCIKSEKLPEWLYNPKPASSKQAPKSPSKYIKRRPKPLKETSSMGKQLTEDLEKEEWINSGKNSGAWRPGLRAGKRKEERKEPLVWKLVETFKK
ncbi:serine/threonine-protein kinase/endoribonuclease Ire1 [Rhodnius prolixus]|uniref:serine/threonine-protein kinase/endoribonuclease Ire1 n=1 Tax=Rhodnius prolixus TaxID=13249 RepID=UPI003D18EBEF